MIFKNSKAYDILKWIALVVLDAAGLLYSTLAAVWGLPLGDEIYKTCSAISLCVGTLIGVSGIRYNNMLNGAREGTITVLNVEDEEENDGN